MNLYTRYVQCTHTPYAKILTVSARKFDRFIDRLRRVHLDILVSLNLKNLLVMVRLFFLPRYLICPGDKAKSRTITSKWIQNRRKNRQFL